MNEGEEIVCGEGDGRERLDFEASERLGAEEEPEMSEEEFALWATRWRLKQLRSL